MLINACRQSRENSIYECDRCGKTCKTSDIKGIYVTNELGRAVKKLDFCLNCYKALKRGVKLYNKQGGI